MVEQPPPRLFLLTLPELQPDSGSLSITRKGLKAGSPPNPAFPGESHPSNFLLLSRQENLLRRGIESKTVGADASQPGGQGGKPPSLPSHEERKGEAQALLSDPGPEKQSKVPYRAAGQGQPSVGLLLAD
ncbi:MAG TPA: hypothetical protein DCX67_10835 [Opitutae bacterium]|nr:hypothetical protein [Opitutae bacterium]